jgi:hypothetical protein
MPVFGFHRDEIGHQVDLLEQDGYVITSVIAEIIDGEDYLMVFAHRRQRPQVETR